MWVNWVNAISCVISDTKAQTHIKSFTFCLIYRYWFECWTCTIQTHVTYRTKINLSEVFFCVYQRVKYNTLSCTHIKDWSNTTKIQYWLTETSINSVQKEMPIALSLKCVNMFGAELVKPLRGNATQMLSHICTHSFPLRQCFVENWDRLCACACVHVVLGWRKRKRIQQWRLEHRQKTVWANESYEMSWQTFKMLKQM